MSTLSVVGFASGSPLSQIAMARISREHSLRAIVMPHALKSPIRRLLNRIWGSSNPLANLGVPIVDVAEVERLRPDVIVVASFPKIIPASALGAARIGALNVHMSLLPRHRGVDPIFWTYWDDDRDAGVTIHWINEHIDAGDIVTQEAVSLARGRESRKLYMQLASRSGEMLGRVLEQIASGNASRRPQDDSCATYESALDIAHARIPFARWPAERVWHVLSGLGDQFSGLIADAGAEPLRHGRATRYHVTNDVDSGRIVSMATGYELHCLDGIVAVSLRS